MRIACIPSLTSILMIAFTALFSMSASAQSPSSTAGRLAVMLLGQHHPESVVGALPAVPSEDGRVHLEILVVDWNGLGLVGTPVRFSAGGGAVFESSTDEQGRASFSWSVDELGGKLAYQVGDLESQSIDSGPASAQGALVVVVLGGEDSELVVLESASLPFDLSDSTSPGSGQASLRFVFSRDLPLRLRGKMVANADSRFAMTVEGARCGDYFDGHLWRFADAAVSRRRFELEGVTFECQVPASSLAAGKASFMFGVVRPDEELPRNNDRKPGFTTDPRLSANYEVSVEAGHLSTVHIGSSSRVGGFYKWAITDTWVTPIGTSRLQAKETDK